MDLSEDDSCSSRGSSKSAKNKGRNGSKSTASKTKSAAVTKQQIEQFCAVTGEIFNKLNQCGKSSALTGKLNP